MYVSILLVRGVLSELRGRGFDERLVLAESGINPETLGELTATISMTQWDRVIARALELTRDPALALSIARNFPLTSLQLFGHLLRASVNLRESVGVLGRYADIVSDELSWSLRESGRVAQLCCEPRIQRGDGTRFGIELALGLALQVGRQLVPRLRIGASTLEFAYPAPVHAAAYERILGCPVRFHAPRNAISFPLEMLDEPRMVLPDALVTAQVRDHAERILQLRASRGTVERARALLEHGPDLVHFEPERLAAALGMTERTMRRKLADEGTPLGELLSQVRFAKAREAMRSPDVPIKQVSERLGFSEPSAFHRAFKRWTGMTPSEYLRAQQVEARPLERERSIESAGPGQPSNDTRADPSGVFKLHEVPKTKHALHDHA